ncbi:MAG: hypothetical protein PHD72_03365 [Patescibacteria group bacterium]|nr:hypothetical protein [Patescibacteria group bacterium]
MPDKNLGGERSGELLSRFHTGRQDSSALEQAESTMSLDDHIAKVEELLMYDLPYRANVKEGEVEAAKDLLRRLKEQKKFPSLQS